MKHRVASKSNKQSKNLRHFIHVLENITRYHTYLYLMELFEKMSQMPYPEGLVHEPDYGKIILVNNGKKEDKNEKVGIDYEIREEIIIEYLTDNPLRNQDKSKINEIK